MHRTILPRTITARAFRPLLALAIIPIMGATAAAQDARKGTITVSHPWSRATSPRATVGAGFLTIRNRGAKADRLVTATSPRAERVEVHTMSLDNGVMRMRPLTNGVEVPAGGEVTLAPGGNHIMLIGLKRALKEGERVPATLRFAQAGAMTVHFTVAGAGATASAPSHGGHH